MNRKSGRVLLQISLSTKNTGKNKSGDVYKIDLKNWMKVCSQPLSKKLDEFQKCSQYLIEDSS